MLGSHSAKIRAAGDFLGPRLETHGTWDLSRRGVSCFAAQSVLALDWHVWSGLEMTRARVKRAHYGCPLLRPSLVVGVGTILSVADTRRYDSEVTLVVKPCYPCCQWAITSVKNYPLAR